MSTRKLFDIRTVDKNVKKGIISKEDVEKHVGNLPDEEQNAEWVCYDLEETEIAESSVSSEPEGSVSEEIPS